MMKPRLLKVLDQVLTILYVIVFIVGILAMLYLLFFAPSNPIP